MPVMFCLQKSVVPSVDFLLKLCDTPIVPMTLHSEAPPTAVPSTRPPPHGLTSQHEMGSVTSIAPRERPKPSSSTTSASLMLLPPPLKPHGTASVSGVMHAVSSVNPSEYSAEHLSRPAAAKLTGDRSHLFLNEAPSRDLLSSNHVNGPSSNKDAFNPLVVSLIFDSCVHTVRK